MFVSMLLLCNFFSWYNGQRWVNEDKYQLDISFFCRCFCEKPHAVVWACVIVLMSCHSSVVLLLFPAPRRSTWLTNRELLVPGDATDVILTIIYSIGIGRTNMHRFVLNLIFLLLLKILHWWLLLIRWLQVNILFFLNRKKEHNKILLYKKKKLQVILSLFVHYIV